MPWSNEIEFECKINDLAAVKILKVNYETRTDLSISCLPLHQLLPHVRVEPAHWCLLSGLKLFPNFEIVGTFYIIIHVGYILFCNIQRAEQKRVSCTYCRLFSGLPSHHRCPLAFRLSGRQDF